VIGQFWCSLRHGRILSWPYFSNKIMVIAKYCDYVIYRLKIKNVIMQIVWYICILQLSKKFGTSFVQICEILRFFMRFLCHIYDRANLRTYCYEYLKPIGVHLAELLQCIKISKIESMRYFGQARCDEHENFISVCFEGHSVIWHNHLENLKISQFW
jgi:hypothetical protein